MVPSFLPQVMFEGVRGSTAYPDIALVPSPSTGAPAIGVSPCPSFSLCLHHLPSSGFPVLPHLTPLNPEAPTPTERFPLNTVVVITF